MDDKTVEVVARAIADAVTGWSVDYLQFEKASRAAIQAHLAAMGEAGLVVVPAFPTEAMVDAAHAVGAYWHHDVSELASEWRDEMRQEYRAMLAAAPPSLNLEDPRG